MPDTAKRADWGYRIVQLILSAVIAYLVGWSANKLETFSSLPSKVNKIADDQAALQVSVDQVKKAQDDAKKVQEEMKQTQTGFATGAAVQALTGRVDTLTGRVDGMEATVNSLVKPVGPKR